MRNLELAIRCRKLRNRASLCASVPYSAGANSGDPARIAAQIVSGVGFLGAGTIIKGNDGQLCGLTTATTIWTSAALGICAGSDSLDDRLCLIAVAIVVACLQVR